MTALKFCSILVGQSKRNMMKIVLLSQISEIYKIHFASYIYLFCISHLILFIIFVAFDANISIAKFNKVFLIKTNPISGTFNLNFKVDDQRLN